MTDPFPQVPLDSTRLSRSELDLAQKSRSNPLPWHGQFSPQLVELLIKEFAPDGAVVLDPFVGSGTSLGEAASTGRPSVGVEVNPAAVKLSRIYELANAPPSAREEVLQGIDEQLIRMCGHGPLFHSPEDPAALKSSLVDSWRAAGDGWAERLWASLVILSDFGAERFSPTFVLDRWNLLKGVVRQLPPTPVPVEVVHADARRTGLPDDSIDFVVTSPPYINVFNYHQRFRESVEALDWNVLKIAGSEIGSNRKHRGNRFLTVIQYCLDQVQVFHELARVCKPHARIVFVVGRESNVRGVPFLNSVLLAELCEEALGVVLLARQERSFVNRFGKNIVEDVLHFEIPGQMKTGEIDIAAARRVPVRALERARAGVGGDVRDDVTSAIELAADVEPSPIFDPSHLARELVT